MSALPDTAHLPAPVERDDGRLRFLTCGSVDDGKSTLIGRLLFDSKAILADTSSAIEETSARGGLGEMDLSLLTDDLQAEREQGIRIDVAYRHFSTGRTRSIVARLPLLASASRIACHRRPQAGSYGWRQRRGRSPRAGDFSA